METASRVLKVGDHVVFLDEHRVRHNALVTVWHGMKGEMTTVADFRKAYDCPDGLPCVNLLFVTDNQAKTDPYGQQTERRSSVMHGSRQAPPNLGSCFLWPDES